MICFDMNLWPFGDSENPRRISRMGIANVGKHEDGGHNYVWVYTEPRPINGNPVKMDGIILNYDRYQPCFAMLDKIVEDVNRNTNKPREYTEYEADIIKRIDEKLTF